jgi:phosphoenolpyruvate carboxylase
VNSFDDPESLDKDRPLREDIRLLGRLLGDTLREEQGIEAFNLVERIRQAAVRFRRDGEPQARAELQSTLSSLSADATVAVARAFTYFSQLSNIAEDLHRNRRHRAHQFAGSPPQKGSLEHSVQRALDNGISSEALRGFFTSALVVPVLTAHPTEVQRKSILDCQRDIAVLLEERDRVQLTPEERARHDDALRRTVLTLWQTRILRELTLSVRDEVDNGLSYFATTFLEQMPRLYGQIEDLLDSYCGRADIPLPAFLKIGNWIGADRDGNPHVNDDVLRYALHRQSAAAMSHYLTELEHLRRELSQSLRIVKVTAELEQLARLSTEASAHRRDEPYRLAVSHMRERLSATASTFDESTSRVPNPGNFAPYANPAELARDLKTVADSLQSHRSGRVARGRLRGLRRAVELFGFHLAPLDLRQHSAVHERVVAELFRVGARRDGYDLLDEGGTSALAH